MKSMRTEILQRYLEIKNCYLNEGWGIYDNTADVDRAVVISDAYYGDESSVVQLCTKTGKDVLIQNVLAAGNDKDIFIHPCIIMKLKEDIYVLNEKNNLVFKKDTLEQKVSIQAEFENCKKKYGYMESIEVCDMLFLVPDNNDKFAIYDAVHNLMQYIEIDKNIWYTHSDKYSKPAFFKATKYKNKLYIIQLVGGNIACIDTKRWSVHYISAEKILKDKNIPYPFFFHAECGVISKILYIPVCGSDYIIALDMETEMLEVKYIEKNAYVSAICTDEGKMFILNTFGNVLYEIEVEKWIVTKKSIHLPIGFLQDPEKNILNQTFIASFMFEEYIWMIPFAYSNMILRMNKNENMIECVVQYDVCAVWSYKIIEKQLWICTNRETIKIDLVTCKCSRLDFVLEESSKGIFIDNLKKGKKSINEKDITLINYLEYVLNDLKF